MRREPVGLALVAGGAVGAGEHVQPVELVAGVADVAAYGGVGPLPRPVAVEAQVQLDQLGDRVDLVLGELQRLHPLAGQLGADHVVVVEGDHAVVAEPAGARLADVVHQGGEAGDEVGAAAAAGPRGRSTARARSGCARRRPCGGGARRAPAPGPAARAARASARPVSTSRRRPRTGSGASTSLTSSSRTRSAETIVIRSAIAVIAVDHLRGDGEAQLGGEPGGAHHPQRVVGEGVLGAPGRPQHPVGEVDHAAERVLELLVRAARAPSSSP